MARTWLITGVSGGFGRQLTEQLLGRGDRVVGTVRPPAAVADLLDRHGDAFHVELLDLTDTPAIHRVVDRAVTDLGRITEDRSPSRATRSTTRRSGASRASSIRMVLGSQALASTIATLRARLAGFEAQTELAASTDYPQGE